MKFWCLVLLWGLAGLGSAREVTVNGKDLLLTRATPAALPAEVRKIQFYEATDKTTGASCVAISGIVVSNVACGEAVMHLEIDLLLIRTAPKPVSSDLQACLIKRGTVVVDLERPAPQRPIPFKAVGPSWYPSGTEAEHIAHHWRPAYSVRFAFEQYVPPQPAPR